ncbi:hypothetical protein ARAM_001498 [Aspergillus rambellii]|uniref:DUF7730 domain-containing protein n=1 Tax=Aspergillus rambellii TaxID=308745 RepID=A0A0F8WMQ9_9EURO|nr:hypothetical protein ARAM_001498 [Aspergillus rambellii]
MGGKRKRKNNTQQNAKSPKRARGQRTVHPKPTNQGKNPKEPEICHQPQSLFFQLPREIREMIYREIFIAPTTVHIAYVAGRKRTFRSFLCKLPEEQRIEKDPEKRNCPRYKIKHYNCSPRIKRNDRLQVASCPKPAEMQCTRALAFLRSCRKVYSEAIDMLYQENEFYIENPRTLLELPNYLPQSQLRLFRHLYLESPVYGDYSADDCLERWEEVVGALTRLDRLESLVVIIRPMFGLTWEREGLIKPLKNANLPVLDIASKTQVQMNPVGGLCPGLCPVHKSSSLVSNQG